MHSLCFIPSACLCDAHHFAASAILFPHPSLLHFFRRMNPRNHRQKIFVGEGVRRRAGRGRRIWLSAGVHNLEYNARP